MTAIGESEVIEKCRQSLLNLLFLLLSPAQDPVVEGLVQELQGDLFPVVKHTRPNALHIY